MEELRVQSTEYLPARRAQTRASAAPARAQASVSAGKAGGEYRVQNAESRLQSRMAPQGTIEESQLLKPGLDPWTRSPKVRN